MSYQRRLSAMVSAPIDLLESRLGALLPSEDKAPQPLHRAMRYAVLGGGKRVRPRLLLAVAAASAPGTPRADEIELALHAACAIELVHCASLVHDDLPCFDDAAERRGRPTVHVRFGEPLAILAGDALLCLSFEALASAPATRPARLLGITRVLCAATGSREGIIGGQGIEPESMRPGTVERYHAMKTAALFRAAATAGALAVGAPDAAGWGEVGERLGLAFQLADDLYDIGSGSALEGKAAQRDLSRGQPNAALTYGESWAREQVRALYCDARARAERLARDPQGARELLEQVAGALVRLARIDLPAEAAPMQESEPLQAAAG